MGPPRVLHLHHLPAYHLSLYGGSSCDTTITTSASSCLVGCNMGRCVHRSGPSPYGRLPLCPDLCSSPGNAVSGNHYHHSIPGCLVGHGGADHEEGESWAVPDSPQEALHSGEGPEPSPASTIHHCSAKMLGLRPLVKLRQCRATSPYIPKWHFPW